MIIYLSISCKTYNSNVYLPNHFKHFSVVLDIVVLYLLIIKINDNNRNNLYTPIKYKLPIYLSIILQQASLIIK